MVDKRSHPRFPCSREVEAELFRAHRRHSIQKAQVTDISEGGLLLRFESPLPRVDRVVLRTAGVVLSYKIRRAFERDGAYFAGLQLSTEE
jgi:hypothetical protein